MARIGITLGDPAGIGPEIVIKALKGLEEGAKNLTIIGSASILKAAKDMLALSVPLPKILDTGEVAIEYGKETIESGKAAFDALVEACKLVKDGEINALVTAPLSKRAVQFTQSSFVGHTEFLAEYFGVDEVLMIAYTAYAAFAFVTTHIPLSKVSYSITSERVLSKLLLFSDFLQRIHNRSPRIAVLALNPHGFEFTAGEENEMNHAIQAARNKGVNVTGPYPADTFHSYLEAVDGFLVSYHDQGMIPAKLLAQGKGVNVTWGLPFVRTSPLHGTAFDIAGTGTAEPSSMIAAIRLAQTLTRN
ncbi:4-hydroxythreonine-4-phosphate dehydrogenase PdxA [candidate division WOR-3 bacterium]|nr:4-hydroxythreonine-4-phosphate dehydrogenase PdxA [candidate division WOR-3 bacterium]